MLLHNVKEPKALDRLVENSNADSADCITTSLKQVFSIQSQILYQIWQKYTNCILPISAMDRK